MDGDHGFCVTDGSILEERPQIYRYQSRLPVMAVDDIRLPVHVVERSQSCLAEIAVLRDIIDQIGIWLISAKEFFVIDEVIDNSIPDIFHDADIVLFAVTCQIHIEASPVNHFILILLRDAFVSWKDDLYITVSSGKRLGKSVHDVSKSAGLYKRITFRSDKGNASPR